MCLLWLAIQVQGQILEPVKWNWTVETTDQEDEYILSFEAEIEENWKIYSQYLESDDGPIRTSFQYETKEGVELLGKNVEEGNIKKGYDKLFDMELISLLGPVAQFKQKVKVSKYPAQISGYLTYMTCDDARCLPPSDVDFSFEIKSPGGKSQQQQGNGTGDAQGNNTKKEPSEAAPGKGEEIEGSVAKSAEGIIMSETAVHESEDPIVWTLKSSREGDAIDLRFTADLEKGWTIYSQYTSDEGPVPTSFQLEENAPHNLPEKAKEEGKMKEGMDPFFGVEVKKFVESPVVFLQEVKLNGEKPIKGYLEYMICNDKMCLPPTPVDFFVDPANMETLIGKKATDRSLAATEREETFNMVDPIDEKEGRVLIGNVLDQKIESVYQTQRDPLSECGEDETTKDRNLLWTFIFGFLGGLLALLTPCVFPMIPLTVSYFTKGSKDRKSGLRNGLIYGLSIIVIYVSIGLIITGVFGATALNALSTNWIANTLFFVIFVIFALSFFGLFEITLPSSWANASDRMADSGGLIGTFFMAFTLAIVSFSCTGPIIGSALVQSATDSLGPFTVMLGFSTALALPFGLFAAFPALLNSLPQSGGWMNSVKVVLGFLELALAFKFLSVADMTMHWGILQYEVFMAIWILIFALLTLYAFGFIKFPHDSPIKKLSLGRWITGILAGALTVYMITGFFINEKTGLYDSLALMSGLAPPATYNVFLDPPAPDEEIKAKYPSYTKCANNIDCFKDYFEAVEYAQANDKPLLLDFTGYGCVNCRKTEEHIWVKDEVRNKLNEDFVLVSLYVDDRKKLEETLISKHRKEKMRSIGNRWADFQIVNFEQNSQPLYVMMTPDEKVIADPRGYREGASDYLRFLRCGLDYFEANN